ncbi:hypothetical protein GCM10023190_14200 [Enteractinococcus fodinae]|uniref:Signal peptidase I n=1 Tax=Enteractinococcus fodinae TaxID=684663 RepID=A0ABU2B159_9MICC|nr:signal peptidase I [Enteractinococcus fodinae]MDR7346104.1 signal peptidase I [Enteractinococcus fodinae]
MRNQSHHKRFATRLGDILLGLLSVGGAISIILVILGFSMNISIMMFRTGSMHPTISAGDIALVKEIPATEMQEGDIITVDRGAGLLPVTHRVTEISEVDEGSGAVTFVMRGDANDFDDQDPYTATTVQRTFFSIPGVAPVIQQLQNPLVLGGLTLGASALVIWAFWPRNGGSQPDAEDTNSTDETPTTLIELGAPVSRKHPATRVGPLASVLVQHNAAHRADGRRAKHGVKHG